MKRLFCFLAICLSLVAFPVAAEEVRLDQALKQALLDLPLLEGEALEAAHLEDKVVAVTFFASWCPPCVAEFRHLKDVQARYGDEVVVVAINIYENFGGRENPERMAAFLERTAPPFFLLKDGEKVREAFGDVQRIPTAFVFDPSGKATLHFIHERGSDVMFTTRQELEAAIEAALASS